MLAVQGLRNRSDYEEELKRRQTMIIASSNFGGKGIAGRMDRLWPSPLKRAKTTISPRTWDTLKRLREQDALLKVKAIKDAKDNGA